MARQQGRSLALLVLLCATLGHAQPLHKGSPSNKDPTTRLESLWCRYGFQRCGERHSDGEYEYDFHRHRQGMVLESDRRERDAVVALSEDISAELSRPHAWDPQRLLQSLLDAGKEEVFDERELHNALKVLHERALDSRAEKAEAVEEAPRLGGASRKPLFSDRGMEMESRPTAIEPVTKLQSEAGSQDLQPYHALAQTAQRTDSLVHPALWRHYPAPPPPPAWVGILLVLLVLLLALQCAHVIVDVLAQARAAQSQVRPAASSPASSGLAGASSLDAEKGDACEEEALHGRGRVPVEAKWLGSDHGPGSLAARQGTNPAFYPALPPFSQPLLLTLSPIQPLAAVTVNFEAADEGVRAEGQAVAPEARDPSLVPRASGIPASEAGWIKTNFPRRMGSHDPTDAFLAAEQGYEEAGGISPSYEEGGDISPSSEEGGDISPDGSRPTKASSALEGDDPDISVSHASQTAVDSSIDEQAKPSQPGTAGVLPPACPAVPIPTYSFGEVRSLPLACPLDALPPGRSVDAEEECFLRARSGLQANLQASQLLDSSSSGESSYSPFEPTLSLRLGRAEPAGSASGGADESGDEQAPSPRSLVLDVSVLCEDVLAFGWAPHSQKVATRRSTNPLFQTDGLEQGTEEQDVANAHRASLLGGGRGKAPDPLIGVALPGALPPSSEAWTCAQALAQLPSARSSPRHLGSPDFRLGTRVSRWDAGASEGAVPTQGSLSSPESSRLQAAISLRPSQFLGAFAGGWSSDAEQGVEQDQDSEKPSENGNRERSSPSLPIPPIARPREPSPRARRSLCFASPTPPFPPASVASPLRPCGMPVPLLSAADFRAHVSLGALLGAGSAGCVFAGRWCGRPVAAKLLHESFQRAPGAGRALLREVSTLASLGRHAGVVAVLAACVEPPCVGLLTELAQGGSLWQRLHERGLRPRYGTLLKIAEDVAGAMAHCHACWPPVVHKDLKPHNILLDEEEEAGGEGVEGFVEERDEDVFGERSEGVFGDRAPQSISPPTPCRPLASPSVRARVADFGLARHKERTWLSGEAAALGTAAYMAPELFGAGPADERCDVWAWAVVVHEMLTGRAPWQECEHVMHIVMAVGVQHRRLDVPRGTPPGLARLLRECWRSQPRLRPSFAQILDRLQELRRSTEERAHADLVGGKERAEQGVEKLSVSLSQNPAVPLVPAASHPAPPVLDLLLAPLPQLPPPLHPPTKRTLSPPHAAHKQRLGAIRKAAPRIGKPWKLPGTGGLSKHVPLAGLVAQQREGPLRKSSLPLFASES